jgi:gluconate kinase
MAWRRFVLAPAALVAGGMIHPQTGWTVRQLLEHLDATPWYVAIDGAPGSGKTAVARQVAQRSGARLMEASSTPAGTSEWLEEVLPRLKADRPEWRQSDVATVSDFWLEGSAAAGRHLLPPAVREAYRTGWDQLRAGLVRPRLIVVLEPPAEPTARRERGRGRSVAQNERITAAIVDVAQRPGQGPLLRLPGGNFEAAADEILAALEAMQ